MKLNPVSLNIPGAKRCIHKNGTTAIVSDADCVYIFTGGVREPLRMLAFNPKSGQAVYVDKSGEDRWRSVQELKQQTKAGEIYEDGLRLLATAHYSLPQSEKENIYQWMKNLQDRPLIDPDDLKRGHRLVAAILPSPPGKPNNIVNFVRCFMLGDCIDQDAFLTEKDPDLGYGGWIENHANQRIRVFFATDKERTYGINNYLVVRLTREDAKMLRGLLFPYPVQRFLHIHREAVETIEAEKRAEENERARAILRGVSRAGGKTDPFGTVEI